MAKKKKDWDSTDLEFMNEVDAALVYKGGKWAYKLSFGLIIFFILFMITIKVTKRDEVTRGTGQVTPSLGVQPIQSEQGGIIQEIFVREGQEVRQGDKLVQMSNIEALAEFQSLVNRQVEFALALKRLEAEAHGTPLVFSPDEIANYPEMVQDQKRLFEARREKFEGGTREIQATLAQRRQSVEESFARRTQFEQSLLLLKEQVSRVRPLVERNVFPRIDYLNLTQRVITQEGELNALAETITRTKSEVREEETRLANRDSEWQATVAAETNDFRRQLDSINERITAGSHQVDITELTAPMNGVVRRILLTEEGVAQRAQTIMELLPTDDTLEIDARFRPADRDQLRVNQRARIKVDAYDFTIYGMLPAIVTRISADTIEDTRGQPWYEVRLRTESNKLIHRGQELEIKPGMTVQAEIISGRKSIYDYLLKPILKSRQQVGIRDDAMSVPAGEAAPQVEGGR